MIGVSLPLALFDAEAASERKTLLDYLKKEGFFIYGAEADGVNYKSVDYSDKRCLVMGSEGKGISPIVRKNCDEIVSLPMKGHVNSLNVSVATAIFIYEMGD